MLRRSRWPRITEAIGPQESRAHLVKVVPAQQCGVADSSDVRPNAFVMLWWPLADLRTA